MEDGFEEEDGTSESSGSDLNTLDLIKKLAAQNARASLDSEEHLLLFLQSWWSRTYSRPLKDPLLSSYSLEELLYEFYDRIERHKAEEERLELEDVKIEETKEKEVLDWAEQEEKRELEQSMKDDATKTELKDPTRDPENVAWMEKQMEEAKKVFGQDFGEDIEDYFE